MYKLNQGYSFVSDREGNGIITTKQVHSGDLLEISVTDGVIEAEVRSSRKEDWNKLQNRFRKQIHRTEK